MIHTDKRRNDTHTHTSLRSWQPASTSKVCGRLRGNRVCVRVFMYVRSLDSVDDRATSHPSAYNRLPKRRGSCSPRHLRPGSSIDHNGCEFVSVCSRSRPALNSFTSARLLRVRSNLYNSRGTPQVRGQLWKV